MNLDNPPEEPHFRSDIALLSPASPKPIHFPAPANIPVLSNMMDVEYNQTEVHMDNPAMRNTEVRDGAWKENEPSADELGKSSTNQSDLAAEQPSIAESSVQIASEPLIFTDATAQDLETPLTTINMPVPEEVESVPHQNDDVDANEVVAVTSPQQNENAMSSNPEVVSDADAFLNQLAHPSATQPLTSNVLPSTASSHGEANVATAPGLTTPFNDLHAPANQPSPLPPSLLASLQALGQGNTPLSQSTPTATGQAVSQPPISLSDFFKNGMPAELAATLAQNGSLPSVPPHANVAPPESRREQKAAIGETLSPDEQKWEQDIQSKYDEFIQDERRYVNEGRWDSFPVGSRLFVGNLSSESVTKRDIFHVFHTYGRLAQISIKQAFGFVQFLSAEECARALASEQGRQIKDKKIHLEISKAQKPRNQANTNTRRSRSPEQRRGADRYSGGGRNDRNGRGMRSPSPRGGYRDRYDDRYRQRSRSPGYSRDGRDHGRRSVSPRGQTDDEVNLLRRQPRDVPEVQILLYDQVLDNKFVNWVESAFKTRGVKTAILILKPWLEEQAVVRRQIIEGVLAVVKLSLKEQATGKIDMQVFDRRGGASNVRYDTYSALDPSICAELVLRARTTHTAPPPAQYGYAASQSYAPPSAPPAQYGYGAPPAVGSSYNAAPAYGQPAAAYSYPPRDPYAAMKPMQQNSAPPYAQYAVPPVPQQAAYGANAAQGLPMMMPGQNTAQQGPGQGMPGASFAAGAPGGQPVDMQQILARLGNYKK